MSQVRVLRVLWCGDCHVNRLNQHIVVRSLVSEKVIEKTI